ncbi:hypothetical protein V8G54_011614 [Vigna mungo]|uniref:Uncharacterized protein n=1 Tax=Vigna mungo TaxID=3915 RepID=A0AAQ3NT88_VIGMU
MHRGPPPQDLPWPSRTGTAPPALSSSPRDFEVAASDDSELAGTEGEETPFVDTRLVKEEARLKTKSVAGIVLKQKQEVVTKSAADILHDQHREHYSCLFVSFQIVLRFNGCVTNKGNMRTYKNARGEGCVFNVELTDEEGLISPPNFRVLRSRQPCLAELLLGQTAEEAMTPIESTFSLDLASKLDWCVFSYWLFWSDQCDMVKNANFFGQTRGTATGMRYTSRIAAYKVCWSSGLRGVSFIFSADNVLQMIMLEGAKATTETVDALRIGSYKGKEKEVSQEREELNNEREKVSSYGRLASELVTKTQVSWSLGRPDLLLRWSLEAHVSVFEWPSG